MARYFGLQVESGEQSHARAVAAHFDGIPLVLPDGLTLRCKSWPWLDVEGHWWASAAPPGVSATGTPGEDIAELCTADRLSEIGTLLYARLRSAPEFRYALAGIEASEFRYFSELDEDLARLDFHGLVISEAIWQRIGRPAVFEDFRPGYVWRPYQGERRGL